MSTKPPSNDYDLFCELIRQAVRIALKYESWPNVMTITMSKIMQEIHEQESKK